MAVRLLRARRGIRETVAEAISAVGWRKLLLWSAVAAMPVAIAANTFWLMIATLLTPGSARDIELLPYLAGMFAATVVGQLLGPRAWVRRELEKLDTAYRVWYSADSPLARLNHILWDTGTEAEIARFRNAVYGQASDSQTYEYVNRTPDYVDQSLDQRRARLLARVSTGLESVLRMFPVPGLKPGRVAEFGSSPTDECLVSLARGLREAGWGHVELRPSWEWIAYSPLSIAGAALLLAAMVLLLTVLPVSGQGAEGAGFLLVALALQWPFYLACIAFFILLSAGRASGIVEAASPKGLRADNLEESLALALDPFERIRLFLGALPLDDQKGLLEAMHYALWKTVRAYKAGPRARSSNPQRPASGA